MKKIEVTYEAMYPLEAVEVMRGRVYVRGSIKDIREAK